MTLETSWSSGLNTGQLLQSFLSGYQGDTEDVSLSYKEGWEEVRRKGHFFTHYFLYEGAAPAS